MGEKIIHNKESIHSVASKLGTYYSTVDKWVRNYKSLGQEVFFRKGWAKRTSSEKEAAVLDYLAGKGSLRDICDKHKIADTRQLRKWIMKYNGHEKLKDSGSRRHSDHDQRQKNYFEERVEIFSIVLNIIITMLKQQRNLAFHISRPETILSNTKIKVWKLFKTGEEKGSLKTKWTN